MKITRKTNQYGNPTSEFNVEVSAQEMVRLINMAANARLYNNARATDYGARNDRNKDPELYDELMRTWGEWHDFAAITGQQLQAALND